MKKERKWVNMLEKDQKCLTYESDDGESIKLFDLAVYIGPIYKEENGKRVVVETNAKLIFDIVNNNFIWKNEETMTLSALLPDIVNNYSDSYEEIINRNTVSLGSKGKSILFTEVPLLSLYSLNELNIPSDNKSNVEDEESEKKKGRV